MKAVLRKLEQFVDTNATVLITGESGTGKDLLARALHFESRRRDAPFVPINCAAIPDNLIESELFGYARGAFTDARQSKLGLFQAARGGTLFLDEIGEMPLALQAKLLRVIEDKKVRPLGATEETPIDVRIVAATNSKLENAIAEGKFRADLFYRLATFTLAVPPLRERREDIPLLIKHFLVRACAEAGKADPGHRSRRRWNFSSATDGQGISASCRARSRAASSCRERPADGRRPAREYDRAECAGRQPARRRGRAETEPRARRAAIRADDSGHRWAATRPRPRRF